MTCSAVSTILGVLNYLHRASLRKLVLSGSQFPFLHLCLILGSPIPHISCGCKNVTKKGFMGNLSHKVKDFTALIIYYASREENLNE